MRKKRSKGSIFRMLISSYVIFAVTLILSFFIALILSVFFITANNPSAINLYALVDNPDSPQAQTVMNLGGWTEGLDETYSIVEVYGEKKDENTGYSQNEVYELLSAGNDFESAGKNSNYIGYIKVNENSNSSVKYWLTKIPSSFIDTSIGIKITSENGNSNYFYFVVLVLLLVFILNCLFLSLFLTKKIKKPLKEIEIGIKKIQEGNESVVLDFPAKMEFAEIKDSFNYMSKTIQYEKQARLESEERKNQLLLDLSHDIKTPISTIKAYTQALEEKMVPVDSVDKYLNIIEKKAMRVSELASDLFTVLSMDNIAYVVNKEPVFISEFLREICSNFYDESVEKNLTMEIDISESDIEIEIDKKLVKRTIENLIGNALKYNKTGKFLSVLLYKKRNQIVIEVVDDGKGITEERQKTMFDAFSRGDAARSSDEGTGLGLFIAKTIMEKHRGSIGYERKYNKNIFYLSFLLD